MIVGELSDEAQKLMLVILSDLIPLRNSSEALVSMRDALLVPDSSHVGLSHKQKDRLVGAALWVRAAVSSLV